MTRDECVSKIKKLIPDENVRDCVFCGDNKDEAEFLTARSVILKYFSNIFNLAFIFIYSRYTIWKTVDGVIDETTPTNFLRVFKELEKIYKGSPLTFDIIENLLVDIQLDIVTQGAICKELRLTNKILKSNNFAKYAYKAKKSRKSSRVSEDVSIEERYDELVDLLSAFPFLRDLTFEKNKIENIVLFTGTDSIELNNIYNISMTLDSVYGDDIEAFNKNLDSNYTIICRGGMYYCLERIEYSQDADNSNGYISLNYWLIGSFNESLELKIVNDASRLLSTTVNECLVISYDTAFEDYSFRFLADNQEDDAEDEYRISNFYSINYKYIKNLALAISDVMQENGRESITDFYGRKHHFNKISNGVNYRYNDREIYYSWSEIISVLMIEEGTTNVLTFLLKTDKDIKDRLLHNLEFRLGKELFSKESIDLKISNAYKEFCQEQEKEMSDGNAQLFKMELNDKYAEMCARIIIVGISHAINGNDLTEYKPSFPLSIRSKIRVLDEIKSADIGLNTKIGMLKQIVLQTFKTLYCFYYGFFGYFNIKKDFDNESFYKSMSAKEINAYQKKAEDSFRDRVNGKLKELDADEKGSYKELLLSFKDFCLKCETDGKENYSRMLKDALGKNKIMDTGDIDYLLRCFDGVDDYDDLEEIIDNIKSIFSYLQTGRKRKKASSLGAIFPYVATCEYTDISRDGNEVYHFSVISRTGQELNIRVLSEFQYKLNEKYYFLPNKTSSDERLNLWIEPVLINYNSFENKKDDRN